MTQVQNLSRLDLPSVAVVSGAGIKRTVVIKQKRLQHKNKNKVLKFSKILSNIFVPSVVDISGPEIKRTVVKNKKRLNYNNKTKHCDFKY